MNKFVGRCAVFFTSFIAVIALINYLADPAMLFRSDYIEGIVCELSKGNIVSIAREDMDERLLQEKRIKSLDAVPDTVILGSSTVMMAFWDFDCYDAGVSGAVLEDYLGIIGLLEAENKMPKQIIIGVDPWIFNASYTESRYRSIQNYMDYELQLINDEGPATPPQSGSPATVRLDKVKELVSLPYFQSSVFGELGKIVRGAGSGDAITVVDNADYEDQAKILPNGIRIPQKSRFLTEDECLMVVKQKIASDDVYSLVKGYGSLSEEKIETFTSLIDNLLEKGISVVFYLPPWHPVYYELFVTSNEYKGVMEAEAFLRSMAADRSIEVHGSYDPAATGITGADFMDDQHLKPDIVMRHFRYIAQPAEE